MINFLRRFNLGDYEEKLKRLTWAQPTPEGMDEETSVMKTVLGLMKPESRLEARAAVEKSKLEKEVLNLHLRGVCV